MTCAEAESHLVAAGDGRVDLSLGMRLAAHLDGCGACRERAAMWRELVPGMRAQVPPPPDAMRVRRMQIQIDIERQVALAAPAARPGRGRWARWPVAMGLVGAAALALLWLRRPAAPPPAPAAYGLVTSVEGELTSGGRRLAPASALAGDSRLALADAGRAELALGRASRLRISGPARLRLGGTPREIALGLEAGAVEVEVAHRAPDESFAVITRDLRVLVRGTRFAVGVTPDGSWVRVADGRVEVDLGGGQRRLVSAGETLAWPPRPAATTPSAATLAPAGPGVVGPAPSAGTPVRRAAGPGALAPPESCADARRACEAAARAARDHMRAGDHPQALQLIAAFARGHRDGRGGTACGGACEDELGYLRAEALRGAGQIDDAIDAYHRLASRGPAHDGARRAAPAAMRQNALYAAAELEARRGHAARARADYERALAAAPRGALGGESLLGAMESAERAGDRARASALARRYLDQFPAGLGSARARRIAGGERP